MKKYLILFLLAVCACTNQATDTELPQILPMGDETAPLNCQSYPRGGAIFFAYLFTDNLELGSYNLEIHSNHDHHTHSTEADDCDDVWGEGHEHGHEEEEGEEKHWVFNQDYPIPSGSCAFEARQTIPVPADVEPGEYHFMIRLTDRSGWQQIKSVSIRVLE